MLIIPLGSTGRLDFFLNETLWEMSKRLNVNSTLHSKYSGSTLRSSSSFNIFSASINDTGISSEATSFWVLFNLRERKWEGNERAHKILLDFFNWQKQVSSVFPPSLGKYLDVYMKYTPCLPYLEIVKIDNKALQFSWFCQSIISLLHLLKNTNVCSK